METIKEREMIDLNVDKFEEHQWVQLVIVIFAIVPFIFSFYFFDRIPAFSEINKMTSIILLSLFMQLPVLIIGIPLYYMYKKLKYPEKISERRYEFRLSAYKTVHFFMSSFWMSGFFGVIVFIICLIFKFSQVTFVLTVYGYMLLRFLIMLPIYYYKKKN